jgi:Zn-dependent protease with chaperone function
MTMETDAPKERLLNPFAFPSETNVRFSLLIITALMLAFGIISSVGVGTGILKTPEWDNGWIDYFLYVAVPGDSMLSVLVLATVIYRSYPNRIRRVNNLIAMNQDDDTKFAEVMQELVSLSGVFPPPSIEMAHGSQSVDGQAFGLRNQYALRLGGRLRLLLRQNPAKFRAIVLHELGHIANADVTRTYFAQAIWIAFVFLIIFPVLFYIAFNFIDGLYELITSGPDVERWIRLFTVVLPSIFMLIFQISGTLAIVLAIRNSLLRVRETYADWRAAVWGAKNALIELFHHSTPLDKVGRWTYLWRLHPTSQERLDALEYPDRLFRLKTELPFFVGALLGYLTEGIFFLSTGLLGIIVRISGFETELGEIIISHLSMVMNNSPLISFFVFLAIYVSYYGMLAMLLIVVFMVGFSVAYLLMGILGLEVQREAVAAMVTSQRGWKPYLKLWKPAALLVLGFQLGYVLKPYNTLNSFPEFLNIRGLGILLVMLVLSGVMLCLTWLGLIYIRFFARRMLATHIGISPPQRAHRLLTIITSGWLLIFFLPAVLQDFGVMAIASGQAIMPIQWAGLLVFGVIGSLFLYSIAFGVTWLLVQTYRLFRKSRCPSCEQITNKRYAVGQVCEHCGQDLAPWLFIN